MKEPIRNVPTPKSSFVPSKWEHLKVMKLVRAIRAVREKYLAFPLNPHINQGLIKPKAKEEPRFYELWGDDDNSINRRLDTHVAAPKAPLPGSFLFSFTVCNR